MTKLGKVSVGGKNPIRIMGILNTSPESFFKKSIKITKQQISDTIKDMELDGSDFIDVGGMSTAPYNSTLVSEKIESKRVVDAIKIVQNISNLPISVDTCRAEVAKTALENGVEIINDISGLKYDPKMIDIVTKHNPSLILCAFSKKIVFGNHITIAQRLLKESIILAKKAKVPDSKIVVDPAIGFFRDSGKDSFFTKIKSDWFKRDLTIIQNLRLIKKKYPLLVSVSNKSFIGEILGKKDPSDRLFGSIAAEIISTLNGADIIRTHNVSATKDAINTTLKLSRSHKGL